MIKVPRMSDRYSFKIGEFQFKIAPLTIAQKLEIQSCVKVENGETYPDTTQMQFLYLRYGLKGLGGVYYSDGSEFELELDDNGNLTDNCLNEVLNIPKCGEMMAVAWQFLNGMPDKIIDPITGKELDGVSFEVESGK